jgi:hypothetical protein
MDALSAVRRGDSHIAEVDLGGATIEGFDMNELVHTPGEACNNELISCTWCRNGHATAGFMICLLPTGLQSLILSNGTINFGLGFTPIKCVGQLSIIRLSGMRLMTVPGIEYEPTTVPDDALASLTEVSCPNRTLILEDCTFEAAFESPALDKVLACSGQEGAHVSLQPHTHQRSCGLPKGMTVHLAQVKAYG